MAAEDIGGEERERKEPEGEVIILPMKPLEDSKTRLAKQLTRDQRGDLVIGMLKRVLLVLRAVPVGKFWVVGGDRRVRNMTRNFSGVWLEDMGRNLNDTLAKAFERAAQEGLSAMYLAPDLPFLKPSDVHSVLKASQKGNNVTLAPARRDGGTNAIYVPAGMPFHPELGRNSFIRHLSQAARLQTSVAICYSPGLGFDLDTIEDIEAFELMEPGLLERLTP